MEFKDTWQASTFILTGFNTSLHHLPFHSSPPSQVPWKGCWCRMASAGVASQMSSSFGSASTVVL